MKKTSSTTSLQKSHTATSRGNICYQIINYNPAPLYPADIRINLHEWNDRPPVTINKRQQHDSLPGITTPQATAQPLNNTSLSNKVITARHNRTQDESLLDYIQHHTQLLFTNHRNGTANKYRSLQRSLSTFLAGKTISFHNLDKSIVLRYKEFLLTRKLCRNTTSFYMRLLRTILRKAYHENKLAYDPSDWFHCVYTGYDRTKKRAIAITLLRRIANLNLSDKPKPALARDVYIFSFYARGMAFVDIANLKKNDISGRYIRYHRKKTGQLIKIELLDKMQQIINRYSCPDSEFIFPFLTNGGDHYKQYRSAITSYNRMLKQIGSMTQAPDPLTSYTARHTWATIARDHNVPLKIISECLGHNSEQTTRIYLASIQSSEIDSASRKIISLI